MADRDPYQVLGLKRDATHADIVKAFRRLAKQHHPDHGGDGNDLDAIVAAYRVLSNQALRSEYDMIHPLPGCRVPELNPRAFGRPG